MVLILLIAATAACLIAGVVTTNLVLTYISLGLAALALVLLLGDVLRRRRDAGSPGATGRTGDAASSDVASADVAGGADDGAPQAEPDADATSDQDGGHETTGARADRTEDGAAVTSGAAAADAAAPDAATPDATASAGAVSSAATTGADTSGAAAPSAGISDEIPTTAISSFPVRNGAADAGRETRNTAEPDLDDEVVLVVPGRKRFHRGTCRLLGTRDTEELTLDEAREEGFTPCTTCTAEDLVPAR